MADICVGLCLFGASVIEHGPGSPLDNAGHDVTRADLVAIPVLPTAWSHAPRTHGQRYRGGPAGEPVAGNESGPGQIFQAAVAQAHADPGPAPRLDFDDAGGLDGEH